jgi:hypothetical protein
MSWYKDLIVFMLNFKWQSLKERDLIENYEITETEENYNMNSEGVLNHDVIVTQNIQPKQSVQFVNINLKISSTGEADITPMNS